MQKSSKRNAVVLMAISAFIVCLVGMFVFSMAATFDRAALESDARFQMCADSPSLECLTNLGTQIALVQDSYPNDMTIVRELAEMGKRQDARAIAVRAEIRNGADPKDARAAAMALVKSFPTVPAGSQSHDRSGLARLVQAALASRDYQQIIHAAHAWYRQGAH